MNPDKSDNEWFGVVQNISKSHTVELTIEVEGNSPPSSKQIEFLNQFSENIENTEQAIYKHIYGCFAGTKWQRTEKELKRMYFLSALVLKRKSEDVWITFEPNFDVPTIFNYFFRFTLSNNKIFWSNHN